jgi:uncharacterized protein with NAD-binding domain and iron-sulfur cluster
MELTDPAQAEPCEVTVYQYGWRLGGKGASGRRQDTGQRIEEHGLHIWFGFYDNAFDVIQNAYDELGRTSGPIQTWQDAFEPCSTVVLYGEEPGGWQPKPWSFPFHDGELPGLGDEPGRIKIAKRLMDIFTAAQPDDPNLFPPETAAKLGVFRHVVETAASDDNSLGIDDVLETLGVKDFGTRHLVNGLIGVVTELCDAVWPDEKADDTHVGGYPMALDLALAIATGIRDDDLLKQGFGAINHLEFSDWLLANGARQATIDHCPLLRGFYQLVFGFEDGRRDQPCVAAGKAAQAFIRILATYKGAIMWKMQAGMGDAIFAPMYEVLKARGVRFEFFHRVDRIGLTADRKQVATIDVTRQAKTRDGAEYSPLVNVGGLPCWPATPVWDRLDPATDRTVNYEHAPPGMTGGGDQRTLLLGQDFDDVVLAIPPAALLPMCDELQSANPDFAAMLQTSKSVATQALQIWVEPAGDALGWQWSRQPTVAGAYVGPLDTYCDMTHLLKCEEWPHDEVVGHCAYFCGVMEEADGHEDFQVAQDRARTDGLTHLRDNLKPVWPDSSHNGSFNFDFLIDPHRRAGEERYEAQYWRANVVGSERYVLTAPGTIKYRLRPHESGFDNLALAGDWTRNGICGGSVEAAVTSGRLASQALTGYPARVAGIEGWLCEDREPGE